MTSPEAILCLSQQDTRNGKHKIPLYFLGQEGQLYNVRKGSAPVLLSSPDSSLHRDWLSLQTDHGLDPITPTCTMSRIRNYICIHVHECSNSYMYRYVIQASPTDLP